MNSLDSHHIQLKLSPQSQSLLNDIHVFRELDSTNSWLLKNKNGREVCLAEKQSQGRGRRGRVWSSPDAGNIYFSLSWCFDEIPEQLSLISLIVGVSLCEVLDSSGLQGHGLKWPNDIVINQQKLAGILVETSGSLQHIVIGIGLNLFSHQQKGIEQPWCGLDDVMASVPTREDLVVAMIDNLVDKLSKLDNFSFHEFNQQWKKWDSVYNQQITVLQTNSAINRTINRTIKGVAKGIDQQGQLLVQLDSGTIESFYSAEVSLRC